MPRAVRAKPGHPPKPPLSRTPPHSPAASMLLAPLGMSVSKLKGPRMESQRRKTPETCPPLSSGQRKEAQRHEKLALGWGPGSRGQSPGVPSLLTTLPVATSSFLPGLTHGPLLTDWRLHLFQRVLHPSLTAHHKRLKVAPNDTSTP